LAGFFNSGRRELAAKLKKAERVEYLQRLVFCFLPSETSARKTMISSVVMERMSWPEYLFSNFSV
jgi:hypothetical protein